MAFDLVAKFLECVKTAAVNMRVLVTDEHLGTAHNILVQVQNVQVKSVPSFKE